MTSEWDENRTEEERLIQRVGIREVNFKITAMDRDKTPE